ncbi:MAG: tRNA dihydrouridine synthase DusB [Nanoarchaeota archaeon]
MPSFPLLSFPAILSPMAGVTDVAFRTLAKQYGAGLTYTEFVNSTGLVRGNEQAKRMIAIDSSEHPVAIQLFGHSEEDVIAAAKYVEPFFDIIDINCGCPAWKVIKTGAGSALLKEPLRIRTFVEHLVDAVRKPITVKIRAGIDDTTINAVEVAKLVEEAGAAAIAVHGRTQQQGYSGTANWEIIKNVKEAVHIPVIGNGDVFTPEIFAQRLEESGVDAIMIARGAMGNPYIFQQIKDYLEKGAYDFRSGVEQFFDYLPFAERHHISFSVIKQHALYFTKGMRGGAQLRELISHSLSLEELHTLLEASHQQVF